LLITGKGNVVINGTARVGNFPSPFFFNGYAHFDLRENNACIEIGDGVVFNNNSTLIADGAAIKIGDNTLIGFNFTAMTSDAHNLHPDKRLSLDFPRKSVIIGKNVFIGNNVTVLKGVTIGDNSVIGNGSIVTKNIPANMIAAGLPCRVIKAL
jgi:maltose O-acetyltransferase